MKNVYVSKFNGLDEMDKFLERLKLLNWLKKKWKSWIALLLLKKLNSQKSIHKNNSRSVCLHSQIILHIRKKWNQFYTITFKKWRKRECLTTHFLQPALPITKAWQKHYKKRKPLTIFPMDIDTKIFNKILTNQIHHIHKSWWIPVM